MKFIYSLIVTAIFILGSLSSALAQNDFGVESGFSRELQPLKIGELAPDFTIGNDRLSTILEDGPVVLFFYRGHWCGYCTRYIAELEGAMEQLQEKGYQVVGVVPQKEMYVDDVLEKTKASFPIVADTDLSIMKAYQVAFNVTDAYSEKVENYTKMTLSEMNGAEVLPIPATYVIGQDGIIQWVHFDADYSKRASIEDILKL